MQLMDEIPQQLRHLKHCRIAINLDNYSINWCRILSINSQFFATALRTQRFLGETKLVREQRLESMVVSGSPKRWDRWHSPSPNWQEKYHLYTTYIPLIVLAFWGVKSATDPTF